jgi:hypothetical protein
MCTLFTAFCWLALAAEPADDNAVLTALVQKGVSAPGGAVAKLPAPTMPDGLEADKQRAALAGLPDSRHSPAELLRKSAVAPFELQIQSPGGKSKSELWRVDVWFVVYGDLQEVADEDFLKRWSKLAGGQDSDVSRAGKLAPEEVQDRKLFDDPAGHPDELFLYSTFELFDRVQVSATRHAIVTKTDESLLVAAQVDSRFDDDEKYPNEWRPMKRGELGETRVGKPQRYEGAGFYAKVTQLKEPAGALFVEYHQAFYEPQEWFKGANLLRSKLPLLVQDSVREFRRRVMTRDEKR